MGFALCWGATRLVSIHPFGLEPLPAVRHHGVGGGVRVWALGKLPRQKLGGMGGHRFPDPLPMGDDGISPVASQHGRKLGLRTNIFLLRFYI